MIHHAYFRPFIFGTLIIYSFYTVTIYICGSSNGTDRFWYYDTTYIIAVVECAISDI